MLLPLPSFTKAASKRDDERWGRFRRSKRKGCEKERVRCDYCRELRKMPLNTSTNTYNLAYKGQSSRIALYRACMNIYLLCFPVRNEFIGRYTRISYGSFSLLLRLCLIHMNRCTVTDFSLYTIVCSIFARFVQVLETRS